MAEKPILVAGRSGQLARCLRDSAVLRNMSIVALGRPELDLEDGAAIDRVVAAVEPSAIINAAAYTMVDKAEAESGRAFSINCGGASPRQRIVVSSNGCSAMAANGAFG